MAIRLMPEEREVIINKTDADKEWSIWCDPGPFRRMLERKGYRHTSEGIGFYQIPLNRVRIASATYKPRVISPEARQQLVQRGIALGNKQAARKSGGTPK